MNSESLDGIIGLDSGAWKCWSGLNLAAVPPFAALYVLRMSGGSEIGRVKGASDIMYIGKSKRVRRRFAQHMKPRDDRRDIGYRISRIAKEVGPMEIAWKSFSDHREASRWEVDLLERYAEDHIEFPPLNRQQAGELILQARRLLQKLPPDRQQLVLQKAMDQRQKTDPKE